MNMALLDIDDLAVTLADARGDLDLLEQVSLSIGRGESFALVGESGSGKSLTALAVMGLLGERMQARGRILFDGRDLGGLDEAAMCDLRGKRIAMVFQEPMTALNPVRRIGAQIGETLDLHLELTAAERSARIAHLLERVGLPAPRFSPDLYPHQLSGGQRQRVMIAMALACGPDLLIADEPTTALDVTIQAQILDLIAGLVAETGMALMLITHDLGVVSEMAGRVAVMYAGRIVESGRTEDVFAAIRHPYTAGLLAASPHAALAGGGRGDAIAGGRRPRLAAIPGVVPDAAHRPAGCAFAPRCPRAAEDCRTARPPLRAMERPGHLAACLHPLGEGAP
ncbi:MAG: ABC transporter ATP-binding protein [Methylobacteriaceae bacterium]|nr:ABC transporter ATP-binding protein [Methylobacteriaceae bacterium]